MAFDEILFRKYEREESRLPVLRFFSSSEPWITVGYSSLKPGNPYRQTASLSALSGVPACRRLTGGGTVKHGGDLIFSFIAHKAAHETLAGVRTSYRALHEGVKRAYERFGFEPRFYTCGEDLPAGEDCFVHPVATDLELNGRKAAGGSQKRSAGCLLHEESIRLPKGIEAESLAAAVEESLAHVFGVTWRSADLDPGDLAAAESLAQDKYGPLEWSGETAAAG